MKKIFKNKKLLKSCSIAQMLLSQERKKHLSFHTPGHKQKGWDITELFYSDNLSCPSGCIAQAEKDIADLLGAERSFLLTDGSTSGVLAMLYAAKMLGVQKLAVCADTHKSFFNGCLLLGITPLVYDGTRVKNIPRSRSFRELTAEYAEILSEADGLFLTSPDYYGNVADLTAIRSFCDEQKKLLLIDGAHGAHLRFDKKIYAGAYADFWVDGAHKCLPTFTQGAVVSAKTAVFAEALQKGVDIFRTTSPSYPIMASVEYGVKFPQNVALENAVSGFAQSSERIYFGGDWTKLVALFGENAYEAERFFIKQGVYPEFCDGNVVMFYFSAATTIREWKKLKTLLLRAFTLFPYTEKKIPAKEKVEMSGETEWVLASEAVGRICAVACGLFPPCTPLLSVGEKITEEKISILQGASNVFGVCGQERKICVFQVVNK